MSKCPHYPQCGGCGLLDYPYSQQLTIKQKEVEDLFSRSLDNVIPSPKTRYFRNRMDFVVAPPAKVGLRERGKWNKVVDIERCLLLSAQADQIRKSFREWLKKKKFPPYDLRSHQGLIRYLVIREAKFSGERMVIVVVKEEDEALKEELKKWAQNLPINSLYLGVQPSLGDTSVAKKYLLLAGKELIEEKIEGLTLPISPSSFFQPNPYTLPALIKTVRDLVAPQKGERIGDLYGGVGTFALFLAESARLTLVESDPENVRLAKWAQRKNNRSFEILAQPVEKLTHRFFDKVIVDPPRGGLSPSALAVLSRLLSGRIVYVSCNPKTQKRDINFLEAKGYYLRKLVLIDQFPHTLHTETVALLVKK
ncbi:23S rRNA (uracil(1939)-C(5))-methyltransferase RlmD [bacterium]|nr:23S rRNA (uracil(1939)-C(5))-methyltransferase RlmD [bacterium]